MSRISLVRRDLLCIYPSKEGEKPNGRRGKLSMTETSHLPHPSPLDLPPVYSFHPLKNKVTMMESDQNQEGSNRFEESKRQDSSQTRKSTGRTCLGGIKYTGTFEPELFSIPEFGKDWDVGKELEPRRQVGEMKI